MSGGPADWLGFRAFASPAEITKLVSKYRKPGEDYDGARTLLIFSTSKQQTWLVATNRELYLVLDDRRKETPSVQWSQPLQEVRAASIKENPYSDRSGLIDIGVRKNWLCTKRLFQEEGIAQGITKFISA
jgi:hypothetical protein